jgi:hypothetical protein
MSEARGGAVDPRASGTPYLPFETPEVRIAVRQVLVTATITKTTPKSVKCHIPQSYVWK